MILQYSNLIHSVRVKVPENFYTSAANYKPFIGERGGGGSIKAAGKWLQDLQIGDRTGGGGPRAGGINKSRLNTFATSDRSGTRSWHYIRNKKFPGNFPRSSKALVNDAELGNRQ